MASIPQSRLEQVIERFDEVEARMGATTDSTEIVALSREHAELKPVVEAARELIGMREGLVEAEAIEHVVDVVGVVEELGDGGVAVFVRRRNDGRARRLHVRGERTRLREQRAPRARPARRSRESL